MHIVDHNAVRDHLDADAAAGLIPPWGRRRRLSPLSERRSSVHFAWHPPAAFQTHHPQRRREPGVVRAVRSAVKRAEPMVTAGTSMVQSRRLVSLRSAETIANGADSAM
jgi:hypothetical protein